MSVSIKQANDTLKKASKSFKKFGYSFNNKTKKEFNK